MKKSLSILLLALTIIVTNISVFADGPITPDEFQTIVKEEMNKTKSALDLLNIKVEIFKDQNIEVKDNVTYTYFGLYYPGKGGTIKYFFATCYNDMSWGNPIEKIKKTYYHELGHGLCFNTLEQNQIYLNFFKSEYDSTTNHKCTNFYENIAEMFSDYMVFGYTYTGYPETYSVLFPYWKRLCNGEQKYLY